MQWFRFYSEALDDPKVQRLPGDLFKAWVNLLCLANEQDERGTLPGVDDIAFRLRLDHQRARDALSGLRRAGLLEHNADTDEYRIHAWDKRQFASDTSTDRVRKFREKRRETADETERNASETFQKRYRNAIDTDTDTDTEQSRAEREGAREARKPKPAPKRAVARPTLPTTDELVELLGRWATEKGVDDILVAEVERFRDYCLSGRDGKPVEYADYAAACRKWITNPNYGHSSSPSRASPNGQHAAQPARTARNIEILRRAF
jgi:hypothetical protein